MCNQIGMGQIAIFVYIPFYPKFFIHKLSSALLILSTSLFTVLILIILNVFF